MDASEGADKGNYGVTAVSIASSIAEEAMGKMFDSPVEDEISGAFTSTSELTPVNELGRGNTEVYHDATNDFNDFDDFNNLFLVFKSSNPADTASTPGSTWETIVPDLPCKYYVKTRVQYVNHTSPDDTSTVRTWHKRLTVTVINPTLGDTLRYPTIMSYWN
jgi:hypothetical protein